MSSLGLKQKILILVVILGIILIFVFLRGIYNKSKPPDLSDKKPVQSALQTDKPQIVATRPDPLEENIVSATDAIEITFNRPLENVGEFKVRLEPNIDYKIELSNDRKTAMIKPTKGFLLGTTYTLFIGPETKFDGVGRWGQEKIYHFKTITYRGV